MRLDEFIANYALHPEAKAAGPDGRPSTERTSRVFWAPAPLRWATNFESAKRWIGSIEDEDAALGDMDPAEYTARKYTLEWALGILEDEPASKLAPLIGMSERRFRHIRRGLVKRTRATSRDAIIRFARSRASQSPRNAAGSNSDHTVDD